MRSFSGMEKILLVVAAICIVIGIISVVHPVEQIVAHSNVKPMIGLHFPAWTEYMSKGTARGYGVLATLAGAGLAWLVFFRGVRSECPF